jgi:hypothetical protein
MAYTKVHHLPGDRSFLAKSRPASNWRKYNRLEPGVAVEVAVASLMGTSVAQCRRCAVRGMPANLSVAQQPDRFAAARQPALRW